MKFDIDRGKHAVIDPYYRVCYTLQRKVKKLLHGDIDMSLVKESPAERMTVTQMADRYPDCWIGLVNVKYKNDDGVTIESGDVLYLHATKDELLHLQLHDGGLEAWYTTDDTLALGMVGDL